MAALKHDEAVKNGASDRFSFGLRRFGSTGVRRLFVPQKCQLSPVFEAEPERPHALFHLLMRRAES